MARIRICKGEGCRDSATACGYCRLHYLKNWRRIKEEQKRKAAQKLNRYIEHITKENPDNYADAIRRDIESPDFKERAEKEYGFDDEDLEILGDTTYDEDIEKLLKELKIQKGF